MKESTSQAAATLNARATAYNNGTIRYYQGTMPASVAAGVGADSRLAQIGASRASPTSIGSTCRPTGSQSFGKSTRQRGGVGVFETVHLDRYLAGGLGIVEVLDNLGDKFVPFIRGRNQDKPPRLIAGYDDRFVHTGCGAGCARDPGCGAAGGAAGGEHLAQSLDRR